MLSFLLFILSFILVAVFAPLGIMFTIIKSAILLDIDYIKNYFMKMAISLDQFGNVAMARLFNILLITSSSENLFGNPDETISSVLGKNKINHTLAPLGIALDSILNRLDNNHSINSIEKDEENEKD